MGKGSKQRPTNIKSFSEGYDRIFNKREDKMSVEDTKELNRIGTMILDKWTTSEFISAIDDYGIDLDIRGSHIDQLCMAIKKDRDNE
jgi:hypothetical protein